MTAAIAETVNVTGPVGMGDDAAAVWDVLTARPATLTQLCELTGLGRFDAYVAAATLRNRGHVTTVRVGLRDVWTVTR